jgi:hypothetical protein
MKRNLLRPLTFPVRSRCTRHRCFRSGLKPDIRQDHQITTMSLLFDDIDLK